MELGILGAVGVVGDTKGFSVTSFFMLTAGTDGCDSVNELMGTKDNDEFVGGTEGEESTMEVDSDVDEVGIDIKSFKFSDDGKPGSFLIEI